MSDINDGGPAFPVKDAAAWQAHGMTLRDYLAAHASDEDVDAQLAHIDSVTVIRRASDGSFFEGFEMPANARQIARYMHADAMLKAREVKA